jgi:tetratricopeptide (TPR) repeat protein
LNSDLLVLGSHTSLGKAESGQVRLDVCLQDAKTGEILAQIAQTGDRQDTFQLVSSVGAKLRSKLGVPQLAEPEQASIAASLPSNRDAARLYALGISKLRELDAAAAKDLLQEACNADPKVALVHAMLASAWAQLGYEQKRKEEAKKALDLSVTLPRGERMLVEGAYYESLADHENATAIYRALFALFPDSVEYGLLLTTAQNAVGHASQALETVAELRRLPAGSEDPRLDLAQASATANKVSALDLVRSAARNATAQGKQLIYARARQEECTIQVGGEHPDQAPAACDEAYKIFLAAGNRLEAADTLRLMGGFQESQSHSEEAIATYQKALIVLQGLGEHEKTGMVLNDMAIVFTNQGKLDRGEQFYREAKSHFEQAGDKRHTAAAIADIADLSYLRGDLAAAAKLYEQSLEIQTALDHGDRGYALSRLSDTSLQQGKVHDAHQFAQQAPITVPPVPTPATNASGRSRTADGCRQISGPVVAACASAFHSVRELLGKENILIFRCEFLRHLDTSHEPALVFADGYDVDTVAADKLFALLTHRGTYRYQLVIGFWAVGSTPPCSPKFRNVHHERGGY